MSGAASPSDSSPELDLFSFFWAVAALFDLGSYDPVAASPAQVGIGIAAVALLLRPSSTPRLAALMGLQLLGWFVDSPMVSNHQTFYSLVSLGFLLAVLVARRKPASDRATLFALFAPVTRWQVLLLYGFALLSKLNTDYLSIETSCAATIVRSQAAVAGVADLPALLQELVVYLSLAFELLIPALLCIRRTRLAGIVVGALFHTVLVCNPMVAAYDFTCFMIAALLVFAPPGFARHFMQLVARATATARFGNRRPGVGAALALVALVAAVTVVARTTLPPTTRASVLPYWLAYSALLLPLLGAATWSFRTSVESGGPRLRIAHPLLFASLVLVVANSVSPYLGLSTRSVYIMFSNLRTEGGVSNHLFIPSSVQVFDHQEDLVEILESSAPELGAWTEPGVAIPWFELHRAAIRCPDCSVTFRRRGAIVTLAHSRDDPVLSLNINLARRKLLRFMPLETGEAQSCRTW